MKNVGTPSTLFEALINGILMGPANQLPQNIENHAKDFLSQSLTTAMLRYGDDPKAREALDFLCATWGIGKSHDTQIWSAIQSGDLKLLTDLLRSHPDVAHVDVTLSEEMEKRVVNE
jgi:hypothetical protein